METVVFARMSARTLAALERLAPVLKLLPAAARVKIADAGALVPPAWGDYGAPRGAYSEAGSVRWKGVTFPPNGSAFSTYNIMRPEGAWFGHDAGAWEAGTSYSVNVQTVLNVRASPSTSGQIIATLGRGSIVVATGEQTPDGWVQIEGPAGLRGWSSGRYLVPVQGSPPAAAGQHAPPGRYQVTGDGVRLRENPSTVDGAILASYNRGATLTADGTNSNGFARVAMDDGRSGWMSTAYLGPIGQAAVAQPSPVAGGENTVSAGVGTGPLAGAYSPPGGGLSGSFTPPAASGGTFTPPVLPPSGGPVVEPPVIDPNKVATLPTATLQARTILAAWDRKVGKGDYGKPSDFEATPEANDRQRSALARFQTAWGRGLRTDGILDGATYDALVKWAAELDAQSATTGGASGGAGAIIGAIVIGALLLMGKKKKAA